MRALSAGGGGGRGTSLLFSFFLGQVVMYTDSHTCVRASFLQVVAHFIDVQQDPRQLYLATPAENVMWRTTMALACCDRWGAVCVARCTVCVAVSVCGCECVRS